jgi:two-component system, OmpR family, phosphate regulon sensor histidine kinase PhoR
VTLGLRARLGTAALAAAAVALLAVHFLAEPGLRRRILEETRVTLFAEARLMARVVEDGLARGASSDELDPIVDEAAREVRARVTVVALDGRVLADSALSGADLASLENHAGRPEVKEALLSGEGSSIRHSATVGRDLLYAAVPVHHLGQTVGVARVATSLQAVEEQVADLRRAEGLALFLAFALTGVLSFAFTVPLARPLGAIMDGARQFAAGNLAARIRVERRDELGELARILNLSADQLQERLAELAREQARIEAILSAMEDGVLAVDHKGTVVLANPSLTRGLDLHAPIGRHYVEVIRQREVGGLIEEVLRTGERRLVEVEILHRRRVYFITAVPFPGAEGAPPGAVLTFHDATERRRLDRVRRDFVANASHELRTPLTSIRGFVEALEDGALGEPETAERFLGKIHTHADRMAALVEDLLELSRLESGERPPNYEQVVPAEIAEDVVASFSGVAARKRIALGRIDGHAPAVVTDADRLRRILENLVENAVKYTPEGGSVQVTSAPGPAGGARLEVRDDGPGIGTEHLPRIFERFYRVDKARSRELGGTGLGLAIVKHLAEGMGAEVSVESTLGEGSRFVVSIPARSEPS